MRSTSYDQKLRQEKKAQEQIGIVAPRVYFEGMFREAYIYAEEVFEGAPLSRAEALKKEKEVLQAVASFPVSGEISSRSIAGLLASRVPPEDLHFAPLIDTLLKSNVTLRPGIAHGGLGRPIILFGGSSVFFIDWERTGEQAFHRLDAVYFMTRLHHIRTQEEWNARALAVFMQSTGAAKEEGEALFALLMCYLRLKRKYPGHYRGVVEAVLKII